MLISYLFSVLVPEDGPSTLLRFDRATFSCTFCEGLEARLGLLGLPDAFELASFVFGILILRFKKV